MLLMTLRFFIITRIAKADAAGRGSAEIIKCKAQPLRRPSLSFPHKETARPAEGQCVAYVRLLVKVEMSGL